ncbi:MAG: ATP-binding protein [Marmoricola sp.]
MAFIGRIAELSDLDVALSEARAGHPQIVVVEGDPGIGKTALLRRFAREVDGRVRVLWASGDKLESTLPFGMVNQLLAGLPEPVDPPGDSADNFVVGSQLLSGIDTLQREATVLLVLDDLHWSDIPSSRALLFCLRRLREHELLILVATRPGGLDRLDESWSHLLMDRHVARWVRPRGLGPEEIGSLARIEGVQMSSAAQQNLHQHTSGYPQYVCALLRELPERVLCDELASLPAPRALTGAVLARLSLLSPGALELVSAAATLGSGSGLQVAAAVAGVTEPEACADEAAGIGLLTLRPTTSGEEIGFPHRLVSTAVYESLSSSARRRLHLAAAALLRPPESYRHRVAAVGGGIDAELATDLADLAHDERAAGACRPAVRHLRQAAALDPDPDRAEVCRCEAVEVAVFAGVFDAARRDPGEMTAGPERPRRRYALALLDIAEGQLERADSELAAVMGQGIAAGEEGLVAGCAAARALVAAATADAPAAVRWASLVEKSSASEDLVAFATVLRAWEEAKTGQMSAASMLLDGCPCTGRQPGPFDTDALAVRGIVRRWAGQLPEARTDLETVVDWMRQGHRTSYDVHVYASLADVDFHDGRWDDAAANVALAISVGEELSRPWFLPYARSVATRLHAARGEDARAGADAAAARETAPLARTSAAHAHAALATAEHARGVMDWEAVRNALASLQQPPGSLVADLPDVAGWRALLAEAYLGLGLAVEARRILDEMRPGPGPGADCVAERLEGRYWQLMGEPDRATRAFLDAYRGVRQDSTCLADGLLCLDYGRHLLWSGRRGRAQEPLLAAHSVFERLGALKLVNECQHVLAASGVATVGSSRPPKSLLTSREQVVATLVSTGMTNREVAAELYLSVKAVEYHLGNIFRKLGLRNRRQLRRALVGQVPAAGGLAAAEPAYSKTTGEEPRPAAR